MPLQFAETINALQNGLTNMPLEAAIKNIERWEETFQEVELPGARAVRRDLQALKRQLKLDPPGGARIKAILFRVAQTTGRMEHVLGMRKANEARELGRALVSEALRLLWPSSSIR
jgi:hypothetical protein